MKRNTIQRALILKAVEKLGRHPTAEEVYAAVTAEHPSVGRGTVYRNLGQLSESGEIRRLEVPGGADHFDHNRHDHHHVRCLTCGGVFDVDMEYAPDLEKEIRNAHGFRFSGYDLMFKGVCPECAKPSKRAQARENARKQQRKETRP